MTRIRTTHIVVLALSALLAVGTPHPWRWPTATAPPPAPTGSTGGGGPSAPPTSTGGGTTSSGGGTTSSGGGTTSSGGGTPASGGGTTSGGTPVSHPVPLAATNHVATATGAGQITRRTGCSRTRARSSRSRCAGATAPTARRRRATASRSAERQEAQQAGRRQRQGRRAVLLLGVHEHAVPNSASHIIGGRQPAGTVTGVTAVPSGSKVLGQWKAAAGATGYVVAAATGGRHAPRARTDARHDHGATRQDVGD